MRFEPHSDNRTFAAALRLGLMMAVCLCGLAVIVLGTGQAASAQHAPRYQFEFIKTPPPVPASHVSGEPEICTTDTAQALTPTLIRSALCDQSTRLSLPLSQALLGRSEPPLLPPPIAS